MKSYSELETTEGVIAWITCESGGTDFETAEYIAGCVRYRRETLGQDKKLRLIRARLHLNLTQAQLGKRVGMAGSKISKLERQICEMDHATARLLAPALGVSVDDLM